MRTQSRRYLGFGRDSLRRNGELLAGAATGLDLRQRQLTNVEPLNRRQVAERAQEVLAATALNDAAELVLETLDAFHERDAEGIRDPCPLRTELLLDEFLGIARQAFIADDHAFRRHLLQLVGVVGAQYSVAGARAHDYVLRLDQAKLPELAEPPGDRRSLGLAEHFRQVRDGQ